MAFITTAEEVGLKKGLKQGRKEGKKEEAWLIAQKMLAKEPICLLSKKSLAYLTQLSLH